MPLRTAFVLAAALAPACAREQPQALPDSVCGPFRDALDTVPHVSLSENTGSFTSIWDGSVNEGCEIRFETTDSLSTGRTIPDFQPTMGSDLYAAGWRPMEDVLADGPGSSTWGIERDSVACVINSDQPAGIGDDGQFYQSDTLTITVQCRKRGPGPGAAARSR